MNIYYEETDTVIPRLDYIQPKVSGLLGEPFFDSSFVLSPQPEADAAVVLPRDVLNTYSLFLSSYTANPNAYRMRSEAVATGNIKSAFYNISNLTLDDLQTKTPSVKLIDLARLFDVLIEESKLGCWIETGTNRNLSNKNILRMFADLGYDIRQAPFNSDQFPWDMVFVNWCLKRAGFKYTNSFDAFDIKNRTDAWEATEVSISEARRGDICFWDYGHVNFVKDVLPDGKLTFIGSCQCTSYEPHRGSITVSWESGYDVINNDGTLISVYRPKSI
jgi:hypothetical protein